METPAVRATRILLIEDNAGDIELIKESLKERGVDHQLTIANDGHEALSFFNSIRGDSSKSPDLVLLDLNLPKLDGFGVLDFLKKDIDFKHIPVTVLTSSESQVDIVKSYSSGANAFVSKPFILDNFISSISSAIDFWLRTAKLPN